jgi:inositol-hexakisphosphate/diphosphoinositol-pentakisphosphate 1-kinase
MESVLTKTSTNGSDNAGKEDEPPLSPVLSSSSTTSSKTATPPPPRFADRSLSHSLLAASNPVDLRRKPYAETNKTSIDRASISMPPPLTKPMVDRRLSVTIAARPPRKSEEAPSDSLASSKSFDDRHPFANTPSPPTSTTRTDGTTITTASSTAPQPSGLPVLSPPAIPPHIPDQIDLVGSTLSAQLGLLTQVPKSDTAVHKTGLSSTQAVNTLRPDSAVYEGALSARTPRNSNPRSLSSQRRLSTPSSQRSTDTQEREAKTAIGTIGVCALDVKARSRPSRQILTRLQGDGEFEVSLQLVHQTVWRSHECLVAYRSFSIRHGMTPQMSSHL